MLSRKSFLRSLLGAIAFSPVVCKLVERFEPFSVSSIPQVEMAESIAGALGSELLREGRSVTIRVHCFTDHTFNLSILGHHETYAVPWDLTNDGFAWILRDYLGSFR